MPHRVRYEVIKRDNRGLALRWFAVSAEVLSCWAGAASIREAAYSTWCTMIRRELLLLCLFPCFAESVCGLVSMREISVDQDL